MTNNADLASGKYVLLTTFRRDGTPVATPVWVVEDGEDGTALAVWTNASAGKVKRLKNNPAVQVAPCTFRGRPTGPALSGKATLLDHKGTVRVMDSIVAKYGVTGWLTTWRARKDAHRSIGIHIELD